MRPRAVSNVAVYDLFVSIDIAGGAVYWFGICLSIFSCPGCAPFRLAQPHAPDIRARPLRHKMARTAATGAAKTTPSGPKTSPPAQTARNRIHGDKLSRLP